MGGPIIPKGLKALLLLSIAGHLVAVFGFMLVASWDSHAATRPRNAIATKLVRLGNKRPKTMLPRLTQPPPPPPKAAPTLTPTKSQKPKTAADALSRAKSKSTVNSALDRLRHLPSEEVEGDPDGVAGGEALVAILGSKFGSEISKCMKANYEFRGADKSAATGREASVNIKVTRDGTFTSWKLIQGSGFKAMDRAVDRAVRDCGKVSAPDARLRKELRNEGIVVHFKP